LKEKKKGKQKTSRRYGDYRSTWKTENTKAHRNKPRRNIINKLIFSKRRD
jgi:hypothetical protein